MLRGPKKKVVENGLSQQRETGGAGGSVCVIIIEMVRLDS